MLSARVAIHPNLFFWLRSESFQAAGSRSAGVILRTFGCIVIIDRLFKAGKR
jgi:hypothetical protein